MLPLCVIELRASDVGELCVCEGAGGWVNRELIAGWQVLVGAVQSSY